MIFYIYPDGDAWRVTLGKVDMPDIGDGRFESSGAAVAAVQQLRALVRAGTHQVLDHDPNTCDCHEVMDG